MTATSSAVLPMQSCLLTVSQLSTFGNSDTTVMAELTWRVWLAVPEYPEGDPALPATNM